MEECSKWYCCRLVPEWLKGVAALLTAGAAIWVACNSKDIFKEITKVDEKAEYIQSAVDELKISSNNIKDILIRLEHKMLFYKESPLNKPRVSQDEIRTLFKENNIPGKYSSVPGAVEPVCGYVGEGTATPCNNYDDGASLTVQQGIPEDLIKQLEGTQDIDKRKIIVNKYLESIIKK